MIRINLLPEEIRGRRRPQAAGARQSASALAIVVIAAILAADAGAGYWVVSRKLAATRATSDLRASLAAKKKERDKELNDFQALKILRDRLRNQVRVLQNLNPPKRVLWSEKLNMLAMLVHPDVFVTQMDVTEEIIEVETKDSAEARKRWTDTGKEGPEPPIQKVPIVTQTLTIKAVCTGADAREQFKNEIQFIADLQGFKSKNERGEEVAFMEGLLPGSIGGGETRTYAGKQVWEFTYILKTKPQAGGDI